MGTVTKSIGTASRDYSTMQAWADALPASLVTDGNSQVGELYNDSEFTSGVQITGHTTNASNTITLKCAAGQSFRDHANVRTNPLRYDQSKGVGINTGSGYAVKSVWSDALDFYVDGLQIKHNGTGNTTAPIVTTAVRGVVKNCLTERTSASTSTAFAAMYWASYRATVLVYNCCFIARATTFDNAFVNVYYSAVTFVNCTFARPSNRSNAASAVSGGGSGSSKSFKNCVFFNTGDASGPSISGSNNASTGTVSFGTSNQNSISTTTTFENADDSSGTHDFRIKAGSVLIDAGTTVAEGTPDISGVTRPSGSAYDIGAWEYVAAGASFLAAQPRVVKQAVNRAGTF